MLLFKALSLQKMRLFLFVILTFVLIACGDNNSKQKEKPVYVAPQDIAAEITTLLKAKITNDSIIEVDSIKLVCYRYFKSKYNNQLLWFDKSTLNDKGLNLWRYIKHCQYNGLIPTQYHSTEIKTCLNSIVVNPNTINVTNLVKADLLLSDAYYLLGAHLNKGRFYPDSLLMQNNFSKLPHKWDSLMWSGYTNNTIKPTLDSLEPKHYHYRTLKKELAIVLNDSTLFQNDSIPFVSEKDSIIKNSLIIKTLLKQGFYDTTLLATDSVRLAKALNKFQKKWFIQPDGRLGKYTKQALTYNRAKIIKQIAMSMERWRWEESSFPVKYAFVNIPAFWMTVYEKDTVVMQSAVVCGKPETQTPILKSKIDHILVYPYWNVPTTIATKEILPAVQRDTTYIRRKNFEVLGNNNIVLDYTKVPWKKYTEKYLPVRFRQRIGDDNSLGVMKFNFYNPYGVYLHDTNSKRYFKTSARSQSHGCIRLEKFMDFADFLIRDDSVHYTHDSITLYIIQEQQRKIKLRKTLPIYTRYYTAHADSTGLKLYLDIYRKDEAMMNLLYK